MNEIQILVFIAIWTAALALPGTVGLILTAGFAVGVGNRDNVPELPAWAGRARRAHANMVENLPVFAVLVLAAQMVDVSNAETLGGAQMFFWARIVHGLVYIAGIPYLRTAAFAVSVGGLLRIAFAVLAAA